jgi:hypothetical protein
VKTDVQKLVGSELKPYYRRKIITKEEYTEINRTISRSLYDRVEKSGQLHDGQFQELKDSAHKAVKEAVDSIRKKMTANDENVELGNGVLEGSDS